MAKRSRPIDDVERELVAAMTTFLPHYGRWISAPEPGVSLSRVRVMMALRAGPQKMSAVRKELGVTATSVTQLVDGMERDQLLVRQPHPTDRRVTLLELTPKGRRTIDSAYGKFEDRATDLFRTLSAADRKELLRLISLLNRRADGGS